VAKYVGIRLQIGDICDLGIEFLKWGFHNFLVKLSLKNAIKMIRWVIFNFMTVVVTLSCCCNNIFDNNMPMSTNQPMTFYILHIMYYYVTMEDIHYQENQLRKNFSNHESFKTSKAI